MNYGFHAISYIRQAIMRSISFISQSPIKSDCIIVVIIHNITIVNGWWQDDKSTFRTVDPATTSATKCPYGEVLAFSNSTSYVWIPYTVGDSLPDRALPVSQLPNGTSIFTVECHFIDMQGKAQRIFGFYSHVAKSTCLESHVSRYSLWYWHLNYKCHMLVIGWFYEYFSQI